MFIILKTPPKAEWVQQEFKSFFFSPNELRIVVTVIKRNFHHAMGVAPPPGSVHFNTF